MAKSIPGGVIAKSNNILDEVRQDRRQQSQQSRIERDAQKVLNKALADAQSTEALGIIGRWVLADGTRTVAVMTAKAFVHVQKDTRTKTSRTAAAKAKVRQLLAHPASKVEATPQEINNGLRLAGEALKMASQRISA